MKYLLAIAVFMAGAMFPFALRGQSIQLISDSSHFHGHHGGGPGFLNPFYGGSRGDVFPPFFGYPSNYPFTYFYPGLWPPLDYEYQQASRIANGDVSAEIANQQKTYLEDQVRALTNEVHSLRQAQAPRQYMQAPPRGAPPPEAAAPVPSGAEQKFPAVVFVYWDGRTLEARNYAIFGHTLWLFHADRTRKIPLADFNLPASRKLNEKRGVEFPVHGQDNHN